MHRESDSIHTYRRTATLLSVALLAAISFATAGCDASAPSSDEPEAAVTTALDPTAYAERIRDWRRGRYERLTAADGWISLVGLFPLADERVTFGTATEADIVFPDGDAGRIFGTITRQPEDLFLVEPAAGIELVAEGGEAVERAELTAGADGSSAALEVSPFRFFVIERSGRYYLRVRDLTRVGRIELPEIEHFPIDPSWRIEARFEPYEPPRTLPVPTILDTVDESLSPGALVFERDGATYRLDAIDSGDDLFVIFADRTTGKETYGGGRYLYTELPDADGRVVVDFNKAYNPPCVFTAYATCPLPPPGNRLDLAVEAGEKMVEGYVEH